MHPAPRPHPVPHTTPSGSLTYLCPACRWPWHLCDCGRAARCLPPHASRPLITRVRAGVVIADGLIAAPAILPDIDSPDAEELRPLARRDEIDGTDMQEIRLVTLPCVECGLGIERCGCDWSDQ